MSEETKKSNIIKLQVIWEQILLKLDLLAKDRCASQFSYKNEMHTIYKNRLQIREL